MLVTTTVVLSGAKTFAKGGKFMFRDRDITLFVLNEKRESGKLCSLLSNLKLKTKLIATCLAMPCLV